MLRRTHSRYRRRRRKPRQRSGEETIPGCRGTQASSMMTTPRSLASPPIDAPETSLQAPEKPRDEGASLQKDAVAELQRSSRSRQRCGARRPAPSWQSSPHFDESRCAREKLLIGCTGIKSFHHLLLRQVVWKTRLCCRDIDKLERPGTIRVAIMRDLGPTQRTRAVRIHS